jgi:hypothetical protein
VETKYNVTQAYELSKKKKEKKNGVNNNRMDTGLERHTCIYAGGFRAQYEIQMYNGSSKIVEPK